MNDACIKCQKNPAKRIRLCIPCWALVVYGEPGRLPEFPKLDDLCGRTTGDQRTGPIPCNLLAGHEGYCR